MSDSSPPRIAPLKDEQASEIQVDAFERARKRYGSVPDTRRVMARSHGAAHLYLDADERNRRKTRSDRLAAHSVNLIVPGGRREDVEMARAGTAGTPRSRAIPDIERATTRLSLTDPAEAVL